MVSRCFFAKQENKRNLGLMLFQKYQRESILGLISEFCYDSLAQIIEIADGSPDILLTSLWLQVNNGNSEINTARQGCSGGE